MAGCAEAAAGLFKLYSSNQDFSSQSEDPACSMGYLCDFACCDLLHVSRARFAFGLLR